MSVHTPIYLDNHATTAMDPRVLAEMLPTFTKVFGPAASRTHSFGWEAEKLVETARAQVAALLGASAKEIVFTSGATESSNLAIKGAAHFYKDKGRHIVTSRIEHKATLDSCRALEVEGFEVTYLSPDQEGLHSPEQVAAALRPDTVLVSLMAANNEIGTLNPIDEIGQVTRARGVLFHCDAVQALGKVPFDVEKANVDLVSVSAHKLYGPKGVGALYVRRKPRVRLMPMIDGGGHERGMRSGTLNVSGIVGLGAACEIAERELAEEGPRLAALRDRLLARLRAQVSDVHVNGSMKHRLPGNLNVSFAYVEGEAMLMSINKDVACSSGSACTSASLEPSYVLRALGVGDDMAHSSIRFGIGRFNTEEEVDYVADLVAKNVTRLREMSPLWEMVQEGIDLKSVQWTPH
ncbi:MAG: IscS subfamily cysteine desulfurase [Deltaproteobacteria bacterium]|nr:IscS subfamily cysteine desulfurase [Deltaproteobacteria bacterium]